MSNSKYQFETIQLHGGHKPDSFSNSRAVPIYQTTSYTFDNAQDAADKFALAKAGNIYTRITNPTTEVLENRLNELEGGIGAVAVASGSAAITYAIQNIASAGDHIVAASSLYGGTYNLLAHTLPEFGITTSFVDSDNLENFETAIKQDTKAIFIETIGNPLTNIIDIEAVAKIAHKHHIPLIVDNTFGTSYLIKPFDHGADIVVYSATKFIGGHGVALGGVIIDSGNFDWNNSKFNKLVDPDPSYHGLSYYHDVGKAAYITRVRTILLRDTGAAISPFNSFLILLGLETLSLRLERHVENALKVAQFLASHPKVLWVNYPGLKANKYHSLAKKYFPKGAGSIFTFGIKGGAEAGKKLIDNVKLISLLANVGDAKSLIIHPASTTHSQLSADELKLTNISPELIRLSIGLENSVDIINDLEKSLALI